MKELSVRLSNDVLDEADQLSVKLKINRNKYINDAVASYNQVQKRKLLAKQFARESKLVQKESMKILHMMEAMDDPIE